jgi:hypothetical protein
MLRKLLLPVLAIAALAGCATDYRYRDGNGDYYYGQPRVEYRYLGAGGYYGDFGLGYGYGGYGSGLGYYYDPFGRLVYGYPGRYRYGNDWRRPRSGHGDGHGDHDHDHDHDGDHRDRPPPWRDLNGLRQREGNENDFRNRDDRERPMRRQGAEAPFRPQRTTPSAPPIRQRSESPSPSRMGGFGGAAPQPRGKHRSSSGE